MSDLIDRQQAIDAVNSRKTAEQSSAGIMRNAVVDFCVDIIKKLPPAQPKIGRWIHDGSKWTNRWICSECGYKWFFDCIEGAYCPHCGAKNEVTT